ncbi:MAG: hypothetical protein KY476_22175 [Planctomycetes bacterium]|nr:hypothetical protein [Planctomycetota bacterium]
MNVLDRVNNRLDRITARPLPFLAVCALILAIQISPVWYVSHDGVWYLSLARDLSRGRAPQMLQESATMIAPGYPLLITPAFWVGARPFLWISVIHWICGVAFLAGVYSWARRNLPEAAVLIMACCAANAGLWYYQRRTLKEVAFLAVLIWTTNTLNALSSGGAPRPGSRRLAGAVVLLVLLVSIRYSSLALIAGTGVVLLAQGCRRATGGGRAVTTLLLLAVPAGSVVAALLLNGGRGYLLGFLQSSNDWPARLAEGARLRICEMGRLLVPGMFKAYGGYGEWLNWNTALYLLLVPVVVVGWWRLAARRHDVLAMSFPVYIAIYIAWPFDQGARFMVCMLPVLVAAFWLGLERMPRARPLFLAACAVAHLAASAGYWLTIDAPRALADDRYWESADRLASILRSHADLDSVDAGSIAVADMPNPVPFMLALALNRPVAELEPNETPRPEVEWLVCEATSTPPPGFRIIARADSFCVLGPYPSPRTRSAIGSPSADSAGSTPPQRLPPPDASARPAPAPATAERAGPHVL